MKAGIVVLLQKKPTELGIIPSASDDSKAVCRADASNTWPIHLHVLLSLIRFLYLVKQPVKSEGEEDDS